MPPKFTFGHFCGTLSVSRTSYPDVKLLDDQAGWIAVEQGQTPPTILLVEDDQSIQSMVEEALTEGGFEVTIFASGEEAVAALKHKTFRAVVSDIHLSGKLDGWDVARMARDSNPALPIIYMTGAAAEEWASKGVPNSVLLTKPFAPAQLVTAVSQLLNAGTPTGNAP